MFVFPPEQRYKTVMFDLPALLVIILGMLKLFERFSNRQSFGNSVAMRGAHT
jgi:hypothetical protein